MPNGVICIVNGDALLVCSIWLCTGAIMGRFVNSFSSRDALRRLPEGPRRPLVAQREPAGLRDHTSGAGWSQGQVVEAETKEKSPLWTRSNQAVRGADC